MPRRAVLPSALALMTLVSAAAGLLVGCDGNGSGNDTTASKRAPPQSYPETSPHEAGVRLSSDLVTADIGETCAPCHEDTAAAFTSSGMHESMTVPSGADSLEARMVGREIVDDATGITCRWELADGHYVQRLIYRDAAGAVRAEYAMRVDLVVGSGHSGRSYFRAEGPLLFQLPLSYYAVLGDLALSPGPGFRGAAMRHATHLCVSCHAGWVAPEDRRTDLGFRGEITMGIGCARCHGAAEEHCETGDPRDVANPARMSVDRQAEVCEQCHRSGALNLVKRGFAFAAYTPGKRLGAVYGVFEPAGGKDDLGMSAAGHGARLHLSRCFRESEDMTCTTCHNPHRGHLAASTAEDTASGCRVCHADDACHENAAARQGKTCAACHMGTVGTNDIVHARATDHFIQRKPARREPASGAHERQSLDVYAAQNVPIVNVFDPEDELAGSRVLKARAYIEGALMSAAFRGDPAPGYVARARAILDAILAEHPDDDEALLQRARLLALGANDLATINQLDALIARAPDWAEAVKLRALATLRLGNDELAEAWLGRAQSLAPYDEDVTLRLAALLARAGRAGEALDLLDALRDAIGPGLERARTATRLAASADLAARGVSHAYDVLLFVPRDAAALRTAAQLCRAAGLPQAQATVLDDEAARRRR